MSAQSKALGITVILIGMGFIAAGLYAQNKSKVMQEFGKSESGTITAAAIEMGSKNKKRYILTINWSESGVSKTEKFAVKESYFNTKVKDGGILTATDAVVRHIPGQEDSAIIEGGTSSLAGMEILGYIVLLGGFFVSYKSFRKQPLPQAVLPVSI